MSRLAEVGASRWFNCQFGAKTECGAMKIKRAGRRELKVVLVGCGGMGGAWLKP